MALVRREPISFWRRARRHDRRQERRSAHPVPPELPVGAVVRVRGRGDVFFRYLAGPAGAPTVLLLHGWTASADLNWLGTYRSLAGRYHVLAIDHRGHGRGIRSTEPFTLEDCADDAAGLLDELGIDDVIAAGYSMGGPIALLLARRHPEKVSGVVLAASSAELARTGLERGMELFVHALGPLLRSGVPDRVARELVRNDLLRVGDLAEVAPWMAGEMKRLNPTDVVEAGRAIARFDARPWLAELEVPVVSIVTTRDLAVRPDKQRATAEALGAWLIELEGGHAVCATDPDALGTAVLDAAELLAAPARLRWTARVASAGRRGLSRPVDADVSVG